MDHKETTETIAAACIKKGHKYCTLSNVAKLTSAGIIGIGTGLAMTPILNYEARTLEKYGIDVHSTEIVKMIFTINTLITYSTLSSISVYHLLKHYDQYFSGGTLPKPQKVILATTALSSAILPLSQLWTVELNNQKFLSSSGFDEFMQWAAFTSLFLVIYRTLESYAHISDYFQSKHQPVSLDNIGSNLFLYGLALSSFLGKFAAYSYAAYTLFQMVAAPEKLAAAGGIVVGGIMGAGGLARAEYLAVKSLFEKQEYPPTTKEKIASVFSAIEGAWCTLPLISTGIHAMEDWQPLIKCLLLVPLFISHTVLEAKTIYRNMTLPKYKSNLYNAESFYEAFQLLTSDIHTENPAIYQLYNVKPWAYYLLTATAMGHQESAQVLASWFEQGELGVRQVDIIEQELSYMASYIDNAEYSDRRSNISAGRQTKLKELAKYLTRNKQLIGAERLSTDEIKKLIEDFNNKIKELAVGNEGSVLYKDGILQHFFVQHAEIHFSRESCSSDHPLFTSTPTETRTGFSDQADFSTWIQAYHHNMVQLSGEELQIPDLSNNVPYCTIL